MFWKRAKEKRDLNRWLKFVSGSAVCRWTSPDGKERVYLIARRGGGFSSGGEYFSDAEHEHCWLPIGASGGIYDSEEIAIREIQSNYPWARDVKRENIA